MKAEEPSKIERIEKKLLAALERGATSLGEHEAYEILKIAGFKTPRAFFVKSAEELAGLRLDSLPGREVVCKLISPLLPHRFEHGGIRFVRRAKRELEGVWNDFRRIAKRLSIPFDGMLIVERIEGSDAVPRQLLVSLRQDPTFGPVVFMGLGGVGTEVYKEALKDERALFVRHAADVPDRPATEGALARTLFFPIVAGRTRIEPRPLVKTDKVLRALEAFALIGEAFSPLAAGTKATIEELEVNPLQITPAGDLVPLDAMIRISRAKHEILAPPQDLVESILRPKSALVLGASANKVNFGRIILRNLIKGGGIPQDRIYLLHPEAAEIDGCHSFRSIGEIPERVDMTIFTIPADDRAAALLDDIIAGGKSKSITLISGGFGETERGKKLDRRLRESIASGRRRPDGGVMVNGPNCMGIVSKPGGYNTFFLPEYKLPFKGKFGERCAIVSQSGAYLVTLTSNLDRLLNPRYMITYGNQIDVTATDYLIALGDEPEIDLFVIYIEGLKAYDGERFLRAARDIMARGKDIILYKAGRTAAGAAAVASHTASMAGDYEVLHSILSASGIVMPDTLEEVEDAIKVFTLLGGRRASGRRIGIFSNAGFECSVAADRLGSMEIAHLSDATVEILKSALPTDVIDVHNPVDATPLTNSINYGRCLEAILDDPGVDCLMAANVAATPAMENLPAGEGHHENIENENSYPKVTIRLFQKTSKPMVVSLNSGSLYDPAVRMMEDAGIPCFRKIDRAMKALDLFLGKASKRR